MVCFLNFVISCKDIKIFIVVLSVVCLFYEKIVYFSIFLIFLVWIKGYFVLFISKLFVYKFSKFVEEKVFYEKKKK